MHSEGIVKVLLRTVSIVVSFGLLGLVGIGALLFYHITKDLPEVSSLKTYQASYSTEVFSDDGKKIGEFTNERRYPVQFERIPKHVISAFLAAEDAKFYEHHGIDFSSILRAAIANVFRGKYAQGGSTITQQLARGLLLSKKKEITRKIREIILAMRMEKELSKNEILNLYLNEIYLGHGAYGIGAAAENYFHKTVEKLSLSEAAMLAALPQGPSAWDPFHNPYRAKERQGYVLKRMVDEKLASAADAKDALNQPLTLYALEDFNNTIAPYFTEYVRVHVMKKYGDDAVLKQGFKIYTTVRTDFQKQAEQAIDRGVRVVDKRLGWRGVTVHFDSDEKMQTELQQIHQEAIEKLTPVRILPTRLEKNTTLAYDLTPFQDPKSPYFGATPVREGGNYRAVVMEVSDSKAVVRVGQTPAVLSLAGMSWVRLKEKAVKRVSEVLSRGDEVEVHIDKIDRVSGVLQASLDQEPEVTGALLSYDIQNGFVRAMVGGTDFTKSKFNCALQAKRQVGSTFKPIIYAAALDKGFSPSSLVTDAPIVFKFEGKLDADNVGEPWRPHNYGGKFEGDIPLRLALIRSMNIPTVKVLNEIGIDYGREYARLLGITSVLPRDFTIALGSWSSSLEELTRAYAIFPRQGKPLNLVYIRKIVDASGKVLEENTDGNPVPTPTPSPASVPAQEVAKTELPTYPDGGVISQQTAYVMVDMLKGVVHEGTGSAAAAVPAFVAGKTGTSNDGKDTWFIGFTPQLMTGIWVGYEKDKPLAPGETGGRAAAPIWTDYMQQVVHNYPRIDFTIPEDIVFAYIDRETGRLASPNAAKRVRVAFKTGTVPNLAGNNLPRIGEPGSTRANAADQVGKTNEPATKPTDETSDFIRQGYTD